MAASRVFHDHHEPKLNRMMLDNAQAACLCDGRHEALHWLLSKVSTQLIDRLAGCREDAASGATVAATDANPVIETLAAALLTVVVDGVGVADLVVALLVLLALAPAVVLADMKSSVLSPPVVPPALTSVGNTKRSDLMSQPKFVSVHSTQKWM